MKLLETKPRCYVVAAESEYDRNNATHSLAFARIPYRLVDGAYRGKHEHGLLLVGCSIASARAVATMLGQLSFLVIAENDRMTYEVHVDRPFHKALGRFREVSQDVAMDANAYTRIGQRYYVATGGGVDLPEGL